MAQEHALPYDLEAEQATLACCLIQPQAIEAMAFLQPEHFYHEIHQPIFRAMQTLYRDRGGCDYILVCDLLQQWGELGRIGGTSEVTALLNCAPTSAHFEQYAQIIYRHWKAREHIRLAGAIAGAAYEGDSTTLARLSQEVLALSQESEEEESPRLYTLSDALQRPKGVSIWTGLLKKGERVELFGESYSGKTFLGIHMANCFALAAPFFSWQTLCSGPVLYIAAEDLDGVATRNHGWLNYRHLPPTAMNGRLMLSGEAVNLRDPASIQALISLVQRSQFKPEMLVIDNWSLCYEGSDIDGQQHREAFKGVAALQRAFRDEAGIPATALIINHKNKAGAYYGHSSHKNFVDVMIEVAQDTVGLMMVNFIKVRNSALPDPLSLRFEPVTTNPLMNESTVVLVETQEERRVILTRREQQALEILHRLGEQARITDWEAAFCEATKLSERTFKNLRAQLERDGLVKKGQGARASCVLTEQGLGQIGAKVQEGETAPIAPMGEGKVQRGNPLKRVAPLHLPTCPKCGAPEDHQSEEECHAYWERKGNE